ncbi:hypothetical protein DOFOFD_07435 [Acetobacteraceae bacterium EV16P]|uniref:Uncharacterized protein n=1 Tax=Sorlinia euscelidii TaxID=3081148 RepID=A0ABU7U434_9PROT
MLTTCLGSGETIERGAALFNRCFETTRSLAEIIESLAVSLLEIRCVLKRSAAFACSIGDRLLRLRLTHRGRRAILIGSGQSLLFGGERF